MKKNYDSLEARQESYEWEKDKWLSIFEKIIQRKIAWVITVSTWKMDETWIAQDSDVGASSILTHQPWFPWHSLVVPNQKLLTLDEFENTMSSDTLDEIRKNVQRIDTIIGWILSQVFKDTAAGTRSLEMTMDVLHYHIHRYPNTRAQNADMFANKFNVNTPLLDIQERIKMWKKIQKTWIELMLEWDLEIQKETELGTEIMYKWWLFHFPNNELTPVNQF